MATYNHVRGKVFVVGSNVYEHTSKQLKNAVNDATSIAAKFNELGYVVYTPQIDVSVYDADAALSDFCSDLKDYDVAIFYFAGHGIEIKGKNYLCFRDTQFTGVEKTTIRTSLDLQDTIKQLHETGCRMIITIVDACRDNPFAEDEGRGWGSINLAPIYTPKGTMIAYSTSPGEKASDGGDAGHSVYTQSLLNYLDKEGLEIEAFFKKVRSMVYSLSGEKQTSWEHTSLIGEFSFNSGKIISAAELGYGVTAICDKDYDMTDPEIGKVLTKFKTYTYDVQASGLELFESLNSRKLKPDQLFVIGRNILQAANGNCWACQGFIRDANRIAQYSHDGFNHVLNGILFEVYFNSECHFRGESCKRAFLDDLMALAKNDTFKSSFEFIQKALSAHSNKVLFIPQKDAQPVDLILGLEEATVDYAWSNVEALKIVSAKYDGTELLTDEENNVFPSRPDLNSLDQLKEMLCKHYVIPDRYLNIIGDKEIDKSLYVEKRFKKII